MGEEIKKKRRRRLSAIPLYVHFYESSFPNGIPQLITWGTGLVYKFDGVVQTGDNRIHAGATIFGTAKIILDRDSGRSIPENRLAQYKFVGTGGTGGGIVQWEPHKLPNIKGVLGVHY